MNTIMINKQEWCAKNLDVQNLSDGTPIRLCQTNEEWNDANNKKEPAWCYFNNDPSTNETHGKLYNYYAVISPKGLAPRGFYIPGPWDFEVLCRFLGDRDCSRKLRSTTGWENNQNGDNSSGFNAKSIGYRAPNAEFYPATSFIAMWIDRPTKNPRNGPTWVLDNEGKCEEDNANKTCGMSVRCMKRKTITIGKQTWTTENLNLDKFRNGDLIPEVTKMEEWVKAYNEKKPAWCYYNFKAENGSKYGKLYNWFAIIDSRKLAPAGFHIPSYYEWAKLFAYAERASAPYLVETRLEGQEKILNKTEFSGLLGGSYDPTHGFKEEGKYTGWWSNTIDHDDIVFITSASELSYDMDDSDKRKMNNGFYLRCIQDTPEIY